MNTTESVAPEPEPVDLSGPIEFYGAHRRRDSITNVTVEIPKGTVIDPVLGAEVTVTLKVTEIRRTEKL